VCKKGMVIKLAHRPKADASDIGKPDGQR